MTVETEIRLRPSSDADASALARIAGPESGQSDLQIMLTASSIEAAGGLSLVAEVDHQVVGHVAIAPDDDERGEVAIAVDAAFRGRGVGQTLLTEAVHWGSHSDLRELWLRVAADNDVATALYEKLGFHAADDLHGVVVMTRPLP